MKIRIEPNDTTESEWPYPVFWAVLEMEESYDFYYEKDTFPEFLDAFKFALHKMSKILTLELSEEAQQALIKSGILNVPTR